MLFQVFIEHGKDLIIEIVEAENKKEILNVTRDCGYFDSHIKIHKMKPVDIKSFEKRLRKLNVVIQ